METVSYKVYHQSTVQVGEVTVTCVADFETCTIYSNMVHTLLFQDNISVTQNCTLMCEFKLTPDSLASASPANRKAILKSQKQH